MDSAGVSGGDGFAISSIGCELDITVIGATTEDSDRGGPAQDEPLDGGIFLHPSYPPFLTSPIARVIVQNLDLAPEGTSKSSQARALQALQHYSLEPAAQLSL
jgi:hypothetical protein